MCLLQEPTLGRWSNDQLTKKIAHRVGSCISPCSVGTLTTRHKTPNLN